MNIGHIVQTFLASLVVRRLCASLTSYCALPYVFGKGPPSSRNESGAVCVVPTFNSHDMLVPKDGECHPPRATVSLGPPHTWLCILTFKCSSKQLDTED